MIVIYQIGDVQIYDNIRGLDGASLKVKRNYTWDNPQTEITDVETVVSLLPATTSLAESGSITVTGMSVGTDWQTVDGVIENLKFTAGRQNTKIIGFMVQSNPGDEGDLLISDLTWLINDCVITKITPSPNWGEGNSDAGLPITFTIELGIAWEGLSDLYWEYKSPDQRYLNPYSSDNAPRQPQNRFLLPQTFADLSPNSYFFQWSNNISSMSPAVWGSFYDGQGLNGLGSDFAPFGTLAINADQLRWQSVESMYAFTGLGQVGELSISVIKGAGYFPGETVTEVSALDLSVLSDDLAVAGHIELMPTDIVYAGLIDPLPGYVERNGEILTGMIPSWSYPGTYAGEVGKGHSTVSVAGDDVLGSVAYLHSFRTY